NDTADMPRSCFHLATHISRLRGQALLSAELETMPARVLADSLQAVGSKQKPAAALDLATGVDEIQHSVRDAGVDGRVQRRFARRGRPSGRRADVAARARCPAWEPTARRPGSVRLKVHIAVHERRANEEVA